MTRILLAASAAAALGVLSLSADTMAQSCSQTALDTARALAQQYCETVKDADVDRLVIRPFTALAFRMPMECTRTHSLICKQHMANLVSSDSWCSRLYREAFNFTMKDGFTGKEEPQNSQNYYHQLQLEGCRLH
ncbi:hypothetical protein WME79_08205 [Sorangium sp. So ce726]|uniref:hypothetical protein n=1 Tax=Sorangium sp. So ce726 TaxID=3133319 RepID=UPI003F61D857